jgi:molybdate transport system substrate-binding protein
MMRCALVLASLMGAMVPVSAQAEHALVAVAANFAGVAAQLEVQFERSSEHTMDLVIGSTGKLYTQITNGAPFDVFLAADQERPRRLEDSGVAIRGSRRTFAVGRLVLWSPEIQGVQGDGAALLRAGEFRTIAIANPRLAPYGAAAVEALQALGVYEDLRDRIVMGENVGQAHVMVASGNAELGLIALSSITQAGTARPGSSWEVPQNLYAPIRQDVVLLTRAADNAAARAFLSFLQSAVATELIESFGYRVE